LGFVKRNRRAAQRFAVIAEANTAIGNVVVWEMWRTQILSLKEKYSSG
jgi:hypothetical protein